MSTAESTTFERIVYHPPGRKQEQQSNELNENMIMKHTVASRRMTLRRVVIPTNLVDSSLLALKTTIKNARVSITSGSGGVEGETL